MVNSNAVRLCIIETPQVKNEIVRIIQELPDDATVEDAIERLYFLPKHPCGYRSEAVREADAGIKPG